MLRFFRHNYPQQQIVIVLLALILWLPAFLMKTPFVPANQTTPLYGLLVDILGFSPFLINALAFLVYLFSVFLFNSVLSANRLVSKYSTIGGFYFVLIMCCSPELNRCYPFLMACPFILITMQTIFLIYQTETPEVYMMNTGYFIALASMFYFPSVFLILWVIITFIIMGYNGFRYFLIPITGLLISYAIMFMITYFTGTIFTHFEAYMNFFRNFSFSVDSLTYNDYLILIVTGILFIFSIVRLITNKTVDKLINIRKRIAAIVILIFFAIPILFIQEPVIYNGLIFIIFIFFYAIASSDIKKSKIADIIITLLLIAIIVNQYLPLFGINK